MSLAGTPKSIQRAEGDSQATTLNSTVSALSN